MWWNVLCFCYCGSVSLHAAPYMCAGVSHSDRPFILSCCLHVMTVWGNAHITVLPRALTKLLKVLPRLRQPAITAVRTQHETRPVSYPLRLVQRANSFVFSAVIGTVQRKSTKWTINDVGEVSAPPINDTSPHYCYATVYIHIIWAVYKCTLKHVSFHLCCKDWDQNLPSKLPKCSIFCELSST
jgi:hypothetical protein